MVTSIKSPLHGAPPPLLPSTKHLILSMAAMFMFFGFNIGSWVSRLVDIKGVLLLSDSELSTLLLASGLGAVTAFPLVIMLMKRLGAKKTLLITSLCASLLLIALSLSSNYHLSLFIMYCEGILCATINTAINALANQLEQQLKQKIIARLHASFSLGVFLAALFSSGMLLVTDLLSLHFMLAALIMAITLLCCYRYLPGEHPVLNHKTEDVQTHTTQAESTHSQNVVKVTLLLGITLFFSTLVEGAMLDWSSIYLTDVIGVDKIYSPSGVAVFSLMMVLARLYADNWRNKYSDLRLIALGSVICASSLLLGITVGSLTATWLMFAATGLSIAAICPCIYAIAATHGTTNLSLMATFGSVGTLLGPPIIGFIADSRGLVSSFYFIATCCLVITLFVALLQQSRNKTSKPLPKSVYGS